MLQDKVSLTIFKPLSTTKIVDIEEHISIDSLPFNIDTSEYQKGILRFTGTIDNVGAIDISVNLRADETLMAKISEDYQKRRRLNLSKVTRAP